MKRLSLFTIALFFISVQTFSQQNNFWKEHGVGALTISKAATRTNFPTNYKLFDANLSGMQQYLLGALNSNTKNIVLTLPNADGLLEEFEITEASNFEPALQAKFTSIRSFSGKGISDKTATIKLSLSPQGVQTLVFRAGKEEEYIEPYSADNLTYAVFKSQRKAGQMPWSCNTVDQRLTSALNQLVTDQPISIARAGGNLKILRLALSCNGEYARYFGANSYTIDNEAKVIAAFNASLTRCNGIFEKDLAIHLSLISNTTSVIYYDPATDPYSPSTSLNLWNSQLQTTLTNVIGEANYDIGHLFGSTGGGGNAGCIGCICVNGRKGSGITSPADGIPQGDNFDIDYVAHEIGHQLGANHTFSMSNEGTGVNKEVGSGITIMGYAGITAQDVAPHSIDIFHQASIAQIETNIAGKTCGTTYNIGANNTAPVVAPLTNYTIPRSTPFVLTGSATDAEGDPLTYTWEQNDNSTTTGTGSVASATKTTGPNWISFRPTTSPTRLFPQLSTILAGGTVTGPLPGGDAGANIEALSSVARTLNFRLTVRDNAPFSSDPNSPEVGQTSFADMRVTVASTGPFSVSSPNTNVAWAGGSTQTVTWAVGSSNATPVNCANVKITLSTDGGQTFPIVLLESTPNDGSQAVVIPNNLTSTARIKIEAIGNIFFDISNTNFRISTPPLCGDPTGLTTSGITTTTANLAWTAVPNATSYAVEYKLSNATNWNVLSASQATTSASLTGLTPGTAYNWRVIATCAAGPGAYVQANFTTTAIVTSCQSPLDNATNGTSAGAAVIPFNTNVTGLISPASDIDYYRFAITRAGRITITLTTLPANYNIRLRNAAGTQVAIAQRTGTSNETINYTAAVGTYYVEVYGANAAANNATRCYTLRVALGTAARNTAPTTTNGDIVLAAGEATGESDAAQAVELFPNPVSNELQVKLIAIGGKSVIEVFDLTGKKVTSTTINSSVASISNIRLDMSKYAKGIYMVRVTNNENLIHQSKIVKQ